MKLSTGKRIGQSGQELLTASVFSLVLHACAVAAAALLYISSAPKAYLPPFYSVKLVGLPSEGPGSGGAPQAATPAPAAPATPPVQQPAKPAPAPKRPAAKQHRAPAALPKSGMPELSKTKSKPEKHQPEPPVEQPREQAASAPSSAGKAGTVPGTGSAAGTGSGTGTGTGTGVMGQGVAVATASQQDPKLSSYIDVVRYRIAQNWRPSPDAPDARVRVIFRVNRSGWVDAAATKVDEAQSKCTYPFKLAGVRAIQSSNPFPPLPDDFPKQTLEFSVDLTPKE
jgi:hypothetical protein